VLLSDEGFGEAEQLLEVKIYTTPTILAHYIFNAIKKQNCFSRT